MKPQGDRDQMAELWLPPPNPFWLFFTSLQSSATSSGSRFQRGIDFEILQTFRALNSLAPPYSTSRISSPVTTPTPSCRSLKHILYKIAFPSQMINHLHWTPSTIQSVSCLLCYSRLSVSSVQLCSFCVKCLLILRRVLLYTSTE